jgi:hypothetical protein
VPADTGLSNVFGSLPVLGVDRIVRRTLFSAAAMALVLAGVAILLGQPLIAPGLLLGLAMALVNHRVFQASALRFIDPEGSVRRKPFAGSVALRLGACTAVAVLALVLARPVGWGIIGGLAVFQAAMLVNAIVALIGYQKAEQGGAGRAA